MTKKMKEQLVSVILPPAEDADPDRKADQNEYVTVNGKVTQVCRGERVEVPVSVYVQLRNKYPSI